MNLIIRVIGHVCNAVDHPNENNSSSQARMDEKGGGRRQIVPLIAAGFKCPPSILVWSKTANGNIQSSHHPFLYTVFTYIVLHSITSAQHKSP